MIHGAVNRLVIYLSNVPPSFLPLCVSEHKEFVKLQRGNKLKINLILNSSLVYLYYSPKSDSTLRLLLDKGEFTPVIRAFFPHYSPAMTLSFLWVISVPCFLPYTVTNVDADFKCLSLSGCPLSIR